MPYTNFELILAALNRLIKQPTLTRSFRPVMDECIFDPGEIKNASALARYNLFFRGTSAEQVKQVYNSLGTVTRHPEGITAAFGSHALVAELTNSCRSKKTIGMPVTTRYDVASGFAENRGFIMHINCSSIKRESQLTLKEAIKAADPSLYEEIKRGEYILPWKNEMEVTLRQGFHLSALLGFGDREHPFYVLNSEHICGNTVLMSNNPKLIKQYLAYWEFFEEHMTREIRKPAEERNSTILAEFAELYTACLHSYLKHVQDILRVHTEEEHAHIFAYLNTLPAEKPKESFYFTTPPNQMFGASSPKKQERTRCFSTQATPALFQPPPVSKKIALKRVEKEELKTAKKQDRQKQQQDLRQGKQLQHPQSNQKHFSKRF